MEAKELQDILTSIKGEMVAIRAEVTLINHDVIKIREQLDRINMLVQPQHESIGILPNTPPPDFLPIDKMV